MKDSSKTGIAPEPSLFVMRFEKNYCSLNKTRFLEILQNYPVLQKQKKRLLNSSKNKHVVEEIYETTKTNPNKQKGPSHLLHYPRSYPLDFIRCCVVLFLGPNTGQRQTKRELSNQTSS